MLHKSAYVFKTQPFDHQRTVFDRSRDDEVFALLMDMGTGKTKVAIDTIGYLYAAGRINAAIVIAPNGVTRNWVLNEIPAHLPDYINNYSTYWVSQARKADTERLERIWTKAENRLTILAINFEALTTDKAKKFVRKMLNAFRCIMIVDESHRIKTPGAKRTKTIQALGRYAKYRRILTGTPVTQGPLDLYSQFRFLDPTILNFSTFAAFRSTYADVVQRENKLASQKAGRTITYDEIVAYRNLEELKQKIAAYSFRVSKEECLSLPPKLYEKRYVELTPNQKRMYQEMKKQAVTILSDKIPDGMGEDEFLIWLLADDKGKLVAKNGGVKILRLQQILGGYVPDDQGNIIPVDTKNPRIKVLMETLEEIEGKSVIIWARFKPEIHAIVKAISEKYGEESVVQYHGDIDGDERVIGVDRFQAHEAKYFVGQVQAGGTGLTLTAATYMMYYSNDYNYGTRKQSEDRAHRIGQHHAVTYIDIQALGTVDTKVFKVLEAKHAVAEYMNDF